ncbi:SDR family NAD(P)-dependent oxidoreductase [Pelomonas sp. KK5]|uniref:SDR family NAD(P)-dependent oxidoreductase n=1 Tax=Pelomonas sp. KK5 TaxID=1855730 RepID=UPI00097BCE7A|nr:SDR family oxidoreductase [Pelomonas sp. KK5]
MNSLASYPSLRDRSVLITGGATGIGASLVEAFVAQGARVGFIDIAAEAGRELAERLGADAHFAPRFQAADITDIAALDAAIDALRAQIGPIAALLNNAANDKRHDMDTVTSESWDAGIAVNIKHQFFAAKNVAADMRAARTGSIINFGSVSWRAKQGGMPTYTTSKAAVQGLTRGLARDLGPYGIRVNTLVPGWVMTEKQVRLWVTEATKDELARMQCIPTALQPQDIACMALFLAADDSRMCTAQDFIVDAGWT